MRPELRSTRLPAIVLALAAAALLAAAVAEASSTLTVRGAEQSALAETVVVNPAGRTLYSLSGETSTHLLCRTSACAHLWPPLTVSHGTRLKAGHGVQGRLATIRRPNGAMQVTLRGKPLYRFSGDGGPDQDNGEGLRDFGGVWHAVAASAAPAAAAPAPMQGSTPPAEGSPPYAY